MKILFTGDIMIARKVGDYLNNNPEHELFSASLVESFKSHNFLVGNLETPVCLNCEKQKQTSFKANPEHLSKIDMFNLFTLSNNHITDCGEEGLNQTLENLKLQNKKYLGFNDRYQDGKQIEIFANDEIKVGVVSCIDHSILVGAHKAKDVTLDLYSENLNEVITRYNAECDYLVLNVHGGNEMIFYPPLKYRNRLKQLVALGINLIVGHHPHVLGGYETVGETQIFYSLGDFVFDSQSYLRKTGAVLSCDFSKKGIKCQLLPTLFNKDKFNVDFHPDGLNVLKKIEKISKNISNGSLTKYYKYFYYTNLLGFQIDRFVYISREENIINAIKFVFSKVGLFRRYFRTFLKGDY